MLILKCKKVIFLILLIILLGSCSSYYWGESLNGRELFKIPQILIYNGYKIEYYEFNPPFGYPDDYRGFKIDLNKRDKPSRGLCYNHISRFWDHFSPDPISDCHYRYDIWIIDKKNPNWSKSKPFFDLYTKGYIYENAKKLITQNQIIRIGENNFYHYIGNMDKDTKRALYCYKLRCEYVEDEFRKKQGSRYYLLQVDDEIYLYIKFLYFKVKGEEELINQIIEDMLNSIKVTFKESKTE